MLIHQLLKDKQVILGSKSPRRQELLQELHISFDIQSPNIDETYPDSLTGHQITDYIAIKKGEAITPENHSQIVITSDTIVWHKNQALGKPKDYQEAFSMLQSISGQTHQVISSVYIQSLKNKSIFNATTEVTFSVLSDEAIEFYIQNYQPFDKAGSYGIQEWIGLIGVEKIEGSYTNVVGFPTEKFIKELTYFLSL